MRPREVKFLHLPDDRWRNTAGLSKSFLLFTLLASVLTHDRGKGLGKNESGIQKHVKITKREDNIGVSLSSLRPLLPPEHSLSLGVIATKLSRMKIQRTGGTNLTPTP
jgi:hypothetical protein